MLINTRVYAISDKFNVLDLKPLAQAQFAKASLLGRWPYYRFSTIVAEILRSTPASDKGLREIAFGLCSEHVLELLDDTTTGTTGGTMHDQWEMVLRDDVNFLFDVLRAGSRARTKELEARNVQQGNLQARYDNVLQELREVQARSHAKETALDKLLSKLRCTNCRGCRAVFQPTITKMSVGKGFRVSCRSCGSTVR